MTPDGVERRLAALLSAGLAFALPGGGLVALGNGELALLALALAAPAAALNLLLRRRALARETVP